MQIKVVAKCRPLVEEERQKGAKIIVSINGERVSVETAGKVNFLSWLCGPHTLWTLWIICGPHTLKTANSLIIIIGSFHADSPRASLVTISDFYEFFSTGSSIYVMNNFLL